MRSRLGLQARAAFGRRLLTEREAAGISQRALGRLIGVPGTTIARWESGEHRVPQPQLQPIASALGLTLARLLGECPAQQLAAAS